MLVFRHVNISTNMDHFVISLLTLLTRLACQNVASEQQDDFPSNWRDYVAPAMLVKYQGRSSTGFSEKFFQGDIRGVDRDAPIEELEKGLNNAVSDINKRWPGKIEKFYRAKALERYLVYATPKLCVAAKYRNTFPLNAKCRLLHGGGHRLQDTVRFLSLVIVF